MKKRDYRYDLIRDLSMMGVIAIHTTVKPFMSVPFISQNLLLAILFACNAFFFMLSGRFSLNLEFNEKQDYIIYYKKKLVTVLLPFFLISCGYNAYTYFMTPQIHTVWGCLTLMMKNFISGSTWFHLWFMYPLIGLLLCAPFLSKMLHAMKDWELQLIFVAGIIWNFAKIYLCEGFGTAYAFSHWMFAEWTLYFVMGYIVEKIRHKKMMAWLWMLAGFVSTVAIMALFPSHANNNHDLAPAYVFYVVGLYIILLNMKEIKNKFLLGVIGGIAKYTFPVYLIHALVLKYAELCFPLGRINNTVGFLAVWITCFAASLLLAFLLDLLILGPLQKLLRKLLRLQ